MSARLDLMELALETHPLPGFPNTPFYWSTPLPWLRNVWRRERPSRIVDVVQMCHPDAAIEIGRVIRCNACKVVIAAEVA